jgi:CheY-specific phosphatase CheX
MSEIDHDVALRVMAEVAENLGFLTPMGIAEGLPAESQVATVGVAFTGARTGRVVLAVSRGLGDELVRNMLGLPPGTAPEDGLAGEATLEMANVIAGNLLPTLYGDQMEFHLDAPVPIPAQALPDGGCAVELMEGVLAMGIDIG